MPNPSHTRSAPSAPSSRRLYGWVIAIVLLYGALLLVLLPTTFLVSFVDIPLREGKPIGSILGEGLREYFDVLRFKNQDSLYCWLSLGILLLAQFSMLLLRVQKIRVRPVKTRHVIFPILFSAILLSLLCIAGIGCLLEAVEKTIPSNIESSFNGESLLTTLLTCFWVFWIVVFGLFAKCSREALLDRIVTWCLRGSLMELCVALPCHILARWRNYCCAGFLTFVGLCCALSVMLFAYGPGVLFLIHKRWRQKKGLPNEE